MLSAETLAQRHRKSTDSHLRTTEAVIGYGIQATGGEIGHANQFIVDDEAWAIRYIEVATRNWWPGKNVLISSSWAKNVSWVDSKVYVALSRETVQTCPQYDESILVDRLKNRVYFR